MEVDMGVATYLIDGMLTYMNLEVTLKMPPWDEFAIVDF